MSATAVNTFPLMQTDRQARKPNAANETVSESAGSFGQIFVKEVKTRQETQADSEVNSAKTCKTADKKTADKKIAQQHLLPAGSESVATAAEFATVQLTAVSGETEKTAMPDMQLLPEGDTQEATEQSAGMLPDQALSGIMHMLQFSQALTATFSQAPASSDADSHAEITAALPATSAAGNANSTFIAADDRAAQADSLLAGLSDIDADKGVNVSTKGKETQSFVDTISQKTGFNLNAESTPASEINHMQAAVAVPQAAMLAEAAKLAAGSAPVAGNEIITRFGAPDWNQDVGQKVVWMVGSEQQSATLTLNPPDLGPVQVVIAVHNDQVDTTFVSQNPEVRQALQDGLENLRNMMNQSGIELGQASVHAEHQAQQQALENNARGSNAAREGVVGGANAEPAAVVRIRSANGLVDTFA